MPLCDRCSLLSIDGLVEQDVPFQPDIGTLKASADRGCAFCALCWYTLSTSNKQVFLESLLRGESAWPGHDAWTPQIWLRGVSFHGRGQDGAYVAVSCGKLHWGPEAWKQDPDCNRTPSVDRKLEVYEAGARLTKYRLQGRAYTVAQRPGSYDRAIGSWLKNCRTDHKACKADRSTEMPTRVIHVGDPRNGDSPRLLYTKGMQESYIALSYCWGVVASDILSLTTERHDAMIHKIEHSSLSKTHQQVLDLARSLGIRYVWVDALCIIQGDAKDWELESKTMARVYRNATLTVIAGRSADARLGFTETTLSPKRPPPCNLPVSTSDANISLTVGAPRSHDIGPVSTRAWCFQERLLSRRSVIFAKQQLLFECATASAAENGIVASRTVQPAFLQPPATAAGRGGDDTLALRTNTLKDWYELLQRFNTCQISDPLDIFAAIAAIAQQVYLVLGSRYLAGLWECDMACGLSWRPSYHFQRVTIGGKATPTTRPKATRLSKGSGTVVRAPSWSWASVEGPVTQIGSYPRVLQQCRDPERKMIRGQGADPERWTSDTTCSVEAMHMTSCELQLVGHLFRAVVLSEPAIAYTESKPRWGKVAPWGVSQYGVALADPGLVSHGVVNSSDWMSRVVAIGFFDVVEERGGVDEVWCLPILRERGLMLTRNADGVFSRAGWLLLENNAWLDGSEQVEVRLR